VGEKKAQGIVDGVQAVRDEIEAASAPSKDHADPVKQLRGLVKPLKVKGLGEKTIDALVTANLLRSPRDLLKLKVTDVAAVPQVVRVGEASAQKILASIEESKNRGLARVLAGLGVRHVGGTASKALAQWAGTIDRLLGASADEMVAALAKNPDAKQAEIEKERSYAEMLYHELHGPSQIDLFNSATGGSLAVNPTDATEGTLTKRDEAQPRDKRLGSRRIRKLVECFPTLPELEAATSAQLLDCLLEGQAVARSLYDYLHSDIGRRTINGLRSVGVKFTEERATTHESEWTGKTVVITGSFDGYSREMIKKRLTELGARVADSVSSKTDEVFVGSDPGSKQQKAVEIGIKISGPAEVARLMKDHL
jgi:DNA ligase (NAD+)